MPAPEHEKDGQQDPADDEAVGRSGGVEDETFAREDGAEARSADASDDDA